MATTTLKLAGYLASLTAVAWTGATQKIDSLTDNEWTDLSDEIDNSSNLYAYADLELVLSSAAFTGADSGIEIYIVPTIDGTNYPSWLGNSTSEAQQNQLHQVAFLFTTGGTAAQRMVTPEIAPVRLPNGKFKFGIRNRGNVSLASSGNTLSWRPHSFQSA